MAMSFSDINDLSSKLTVEDVYTGEVSIEGNSENMDNETKHLVAANSELEADVLYLQKKCKTLEKEICDTAQAEGALEMISKGAELCATDRTVDSESKVMNNNYCYQENYVKLTKDCINDLNNELNFKSKADGNCHCYLKNQYSKESSFKNVHNFLSLHTTSDSAMYPVGSPNSEVALKDIDSSSLKNIDCLDILQLENIDCLLQSETAPFHPEIAKSVQELVLEMKVLLDNLKNGMDSVKDPIILSFFTRFCFIRHYLEKILFIEFKKLNDFNIEKQNFKDCAIFIKSSVLKQDKLIQSLLEQFNSCVKENKSLHERLCILQDKLHAFGLLKPQSESKEEFKNKSGIVNQISDVSRISEDYINLDLQHSNDMPNGYLESLEILNKSSANLHVLSMQAINFQLSLNSLNKLNDDLISRVQDQELHMKSITKQLDEAHNLLSVMKNQHRKLQSAENIVKYDLQEKRRLLNKLKQQLETTRENCNLVRIKNSKSEADWQDLRREFVQRNRQTSEESSFIDDKVEESSLIDDKMDESNLIGNKMEESCLIDVKDGKSDFNKNEYTTDDNCIEGNSTCGSDEPENVCENEVTLSNTDIESKYEFKKNRLQLLEEQCQILCSNLKNNSKRGHELNCRLESWCKGVEKNSSKKNNFSENLKTNKEYKSNEDPEINGEINIVSNSDGDSSISSPKTLSLNSDSGIYISQNSSITSTALSFSSPSIKADELVPKILDLDRKFTLEHEILSVDPDPLSKKLFVDCNSKIGDNVQDMSHFELYKNNEECQVEKSDSDMMLIHKTLNELKASPEIKSFDTSRNSDDLSKIVAELQEEKKLLQSRCQQLEMKIGVIFEKLHQKTQEFELTEAAKEQEIEELKFQLNSKVLKYERAIKEYNDNTDGLREMKQKVNDQEQLILTLEETLAEIQLAREGEKDYQWEQLEEVKMSTMKEKKMLESEMMHLRSDIKDLQKKIIKLLKEKDILWKTNDRLRYLHKIQIDDRWIDDHEVSECLGCRSQFSFLLRKHHCRQCGRIFCHSCSNNWLRTPSSRRQIRVCNECYMQHMEIKTNVRRDSNVQYFEDSDDEVVVEDMSINFNRSNSFSSDMHPSIADSMISLPAMQATKLKHRKYFTSAPELHFSHENQQISEGCSFKASPLPCHMEVVENDISGNLLIKANEEAILPILNEVNSTSVAWSLELPCEPIPVALIYEDTVLHKSSCETDGVIHLSQPGLYKLLLDNKSRSSSVLMQYSFKANILKEAEISV